MSSGQADVTSQACSHLSGSDDAAERISAALARIEMLDSKINAFTALLPGRAAKEAAAQTRERQGSDSPIAGLGYAAKNLFDISGLTTLAGSATHEQNAFAKADAEAIARLSRAGAVLLGATNMDEFAYGFTTENACFGSTRNPHDLTRTAGGSSGGSAAAVAAGLVDFALGSDTNGSIRVPAGFCGIYGFKPTFGACDLRGVFPFIQSLDHIGPFARSAEVLEEVARVIADKPHTSLCLDADKVDGGLRVGILSGFFEKNRSLEVEAASEQLFSAFASAQRVALKDVGKMRSAAFLMTAMEGGRRHAGALRDSYDLLGPSTAVRLSAGLVLPDELKAKIGDVRRRFQEQVARVFEQFDILLAPSIPCTAPKLGQEMVMLGGREVPARASLGLMTQPLTPLGTPIVAAPIAAVSGLPIGIQIMGDIGRDATVLAFARHLEKRGLLASAAVPDLGKTP